ncbi:hypothetical protein [Bradyrhizobium sp. URHC0002]
MRPGIIARQSAARLKAEQYSVGEGVRAARGVALQLFDLRRRQGDADQRVNEAKAKLEAVDVAALEAEFTAALEQQVSIAQDLKALEAATLAA